MNSLTPIEYNGMRVLTTSQLAESYGTDGKRINDNFQNNQQRYSLGKHYFALEGEELKAFKASTQISGNLKYAPVIYLWTKKGTLLHAKSLGTDEAWEIYESLVDDYFDRVALLPRMEDYSPMLQLLMKQELETNALKREVKTLHEGFETLTDNLTAVPDPSKVKDLINEYQRWTRLEFDEIYNRIYSIMLDQHGLDVPRRVQHERERIDSEYYAAKGRHYATDTLKKKVTGIDVMVRMGALDKFHSILVGLLAREKGNRRL